MDIKNTLRIAREAGFVASHYPGGTTGTVQLVHANGNVLHVGIHEGGFTGAVGYGWGDAPWAGREWRTNDADTFGILIAR